MYVYKLSFSKTLKTPGDQDWCSFHGAGSATYDEGHLNSSMFLREFANSFNSPQPHSFAHLAIIIQYLDRARIVNCFEIIFI